MKAMIPAAKKRAVAEGVCQVPKKIGVDFNEFPAWCIDVFLARCNLQLAEATAWLTLKKDSALPVEGYRLTISQRGVEVQAAEPRGVVWALTTLAQLVHDGAIPCCTIEDAPKYPHRGVNLDCARHFFPASEVKKIIEELSLAKLNVLHWHLADDQSWRIESKCFPLLHETSKDYFTQDEIRDVVEFAQVRGIEVVPEIDMPGHASGILAAYPQYSCFGKQVQLATCGGIYPVILCPGKEEMFVFIEQLLDEIIPLFPGPRFHIGGDEAPKTEWAKCPDCKARMEEQGITSLEDLQGYFSERICKILQKHGKQAICWNETLLAANAPQGVQIQYWTLQHRKAMEPFIAKGGQWIYSDMFEYYFDYPHSMTSLKKAYTIVPHLGKTPVTEGLIGMEACLWAEHITQPERLEQLLFPRIYAVAEKCWSGEGDYGDFCKRLRQAIQSPLHKGISYAPENWWDPKGSARRKEAVGYFTTINQGMTKEIREETTKSAAPNREFAQSFMSKFFKPWDLPFLAGSFLKK